MAKSKQLSKKEMEGPQVLKSMRFSEWLVKLHIDPFDQPPARQR
jgi:hypothetical protein